MEKTSLKQFSVGKEINIETATSEKTGVAKVIAVLDENTIVISCSTQEGERPPLSPGEVVEIFIEEGDTVIYSQGSVGTPKERVISEPLPKNNEAFYQIKNIIFKNKHKKRANERVPVKINGHIVTVRGIFARKSWDAEIFNISLGGFGLVVDEAPPELGTEIVIFLTLEDGQTIKIRGAVKSINPLTIKAKQGFKIGIEATKFSENVFTVLANYLDYKKDGRIQNNAKWQCSNNDCRKVLTEDEVFRGTCFSCKKIFQLPTAIKEEQKPEIQKKEIPPQKPEAKKITEAAGTQISFDQDKKWISKGIENHERGYLETAIACFTKAIEINPKSSEAYLRRGYIYNFLMGETKKAIIDFTKVIELSPNNLEAYCNRGLAYKNTENCDQAIADYTKAIQISQKDPGVYVLRGEAYCYKKDYVQAIVDFTRAINDRPKFAKAYFGRGKTFFCKGEHDRAITDYTRAIELNPREPEFYYHRGIAYTDKKEYDSAIADYNRAIEHKTHYTQPIEKRAFVYYCQGNFNRAWEDVRKLRELGSAVNEEFLQALRKASGKEE
ncbi:MAG: tetratricopeptide repeat protein [Candidatus Ratteibacteria bacterium]